MHKTYLVGGVVVIVALVAGLVWWMVGGTSRTVATKQYTNDTYGVSFSYPVNYFVTEKEVGNAQRRHHLVMLVEDIQGNRDLLEGKIVGEGPTAITFDFFQNNLDKQTPLQWVRNSSDSNFKLSDETYDTKPIAGVPAVWYSWDGLYRGDSVVFEHKQRIVMATVTYLEKDDEIRGVFEKIKSSLVLK